MRREMKSNKNLPFLGTAHVWLTFLALFFATQNMRAQCSIDVEANNGYTVHINVTPVSISAPSSCQWGYNYNVVFNYDISFSGTNIPNSLFTLQATLGCGSNSHFVNFPNGGGSGTVTSTSNQWRSASDCASASPESLGCNTLNIEIQGPGLPNQTVSCSVNYADLADEDDDEDEDDEDEEEFDEGACSIQVVSTQNYTVNVQLMPEEIVAPENCEWGYNYNTEIAYIVTIDGAGAPASLWTLQGNLVCNGQNHFFNLPNGGGSGVITTSSNVWTSNTDCASASLESHGCGSIQLEIYGPGISNQTVACTVDYDADDDEDEEEDEDGISLTCGDDEFVVDADLNCQEYVEVTSPEVNNLPEGMQMAEGQYLNFDGSNDYAAIENLFLQGSYSQFSVEAWIRTEEQGNQQIVSFDRTQYFQLTIKSNGAGNGKVGFSVRTNQGIKDMGSTLRVDDGEWHHICATYNNGSMRIFIDGVLDAVSSKGSTMGHNQSRYGFIGTGSKATTYNGTRGPNHHFEGDIAEIRLWNKALVASDLMGAMAPNPADPNLLLWYNGNSGNATQWPDQSVQGNNGNLINMSPANDWLTDDEVPTGYTLTNSFNGTADASGIYPPGVTTVVWTLTGPDGVVATCTQEVQVALADPEMICDSQFSDYIWRGTQNDQWDLAANWLDGEVPPDGANVTINTDNHNPMISGVINLNNLLIASGSAIDFENTSANLRLTGDFVNNGSFNPQEGKLTFNGEGTQYIKGAEVPIFHGLRVDVGDSLILFTDIHLTGAMQPNTGVFDWNNRRVTLLSDAVNTGSIGEIKSGAEILGDTIAYHRFFPAASGNWRMICSPLTDATFEQWNDDIPTTGFPGSNFPNYPSAANPWPSIRTYNESITGDNMHSGFEGIENITQPIENGEGYFTYFIPSPTLIDMEGTFKRGERMWELSHTNSNSDPYQDGWNLLGNPYPSAIDWDSQLGWSKNNIASAVYAYDPITGQYSSYINGVMTGQMNGQIGSFQAFWVKAEGSNATLSITEKAKVNTNGVFMKSTNSATQSLVRIRLKTSNANVFDEAVLGFHFGATPEFDSQLDAYKFFATNANLPNLAVVSDLESRQPMSVAMVNVPEEDMIVDLHVRKGVYSALTLENTLVDSFEEDLCLVLEDRELEVRVPFNQGDSYDFVPAEMDLGERFAVHVSATLDVAVLHEGCPGADDGSLVVQGFGDAPWSFTWFDEMGQVIQTTTESTVADVMSDLTPGFYEVEVTNGAEFCNTATKIVQVEAAPVGEIASFAAVATCNQFADGSISLEPDGHYTWQVNLSCAAQDVNITISELIGDSLVSGLPAGNYQLSAQNQCGSETITGSLNLRDPEAVRAEFNLLTSTVNMAEGGLAQFVNASSSNSNLFRWDFGDGTQDSTSLSPQHTYGQWGEYVVRLIASNASCSDTAEVAVQVLGMPVSEGGTHPAVQAEALADQGKEEPAVIGVVVTQVQLRITPEEEVAEEVTVVIYSLSGQLVKEQVFSTLPLGDNTVDISALNQGLYTYGIRTSSQLLSSGEFAK